MIERISTIIPVHNGADLLHAAIESVLAQELPSNEIIVVDDSSTDGAAAIVGSFAGVRYLRCEHRSAGAARNEGVQASAGTLLAFLDHDDVWHRRKLRLQAELLAEHPHLDFVLTRQASLAMDSDMQPPWMNPALMTEPHTGFLPTMLIRRSSFLRVGYFWQLGCEDTEWYFRAIDAGLIAAVVPEVLLDRRIHSGHMSSDWWETRRGALLRAVREHLVRQGHLAAPRPSKRAT